MENPSEKIYSVLKTLATDLGVKDVEFSVMHPKDKSHGDLATNIALVLYKNIKSGLSHAVRDARHSLVKASKTSRLLSESSQTDSIHSQYSTQTAFSSLTDELPGLNSPLDLAQEIVKEIEKLNLDMFEKIEAVAPGFINFHFSKKYLQNQVQNIIQEGSSYGSSSLGEGKKASVEFVSANPTGPLHIGNARGGPLGDTIANVLEKAGYNVTREYLHNDVGGQVARLGEAIYFILHPDQKPQDYEVQYQGEYIKDLSKLVKESLSKRDELSKEEFIQKAGEIAVSLLLKEILKDCEDMGIKFDKVRKESDLRKEVPQVLSKLQKFIKEKDGADWFAPNDKFLKDRETVVQKSDGEYTYFASDIAYHNEKMMQNDMVIDILGANHSGHVPRLLAVVKALGFDPNNLKIVLYQWIRLKRGSQIVKMSKRAGTFVTAREVLDEVGKDAFRFFLLTPRSQTHMDFDLELAKKRAFENPVYYIQYAYTRISSIFAKFKISNLKFKIAGVDLSLLQTPQETILIRHLITFPYLVEEIAANLEVNSLTNYALELANLFHRFYEANQVISKDPSTSSGQALTNARLALLKATQITLKNTLDLLGVSAPDRM